MGFIEWKDTSSRGGGAEDLSETVATSDAADGSGAPGDSSLTAPGGPYFEADPGSIHELAAGQTFSSWDPSHPSSSQGDFVKLIIRMVASGLGVTYHSIASDLADVNFSTAREGRIIQRELWRILQGWWIQTFRQPMYERWLQASTLSGRLVLPSADWRLYTRARWIPRGFDWVDPESEANASATQLSLGLTSRKRILAERGLELDTVMRELAEEQAIAEELGLDIDGPKGSEPAGAAAAGKGKDEPGADGKKNGNGNGRTRRSITNRLTSATR